MFIWHLPGRPIRKCMWITIKLASWLTITSCSKILSPLVHGFQNGALQGSDNMNELKQWLSRHSRISQVWIRVGSAKLCLVEICSSVAKGYFQSFRSLFTITACYINMHFTGISKRWFFHKKRNFVTHWCHQDAVSWSLPRADIRAWSLLECSSYHIVNSGRNPKILSDMLFLLCRHKHTNRAKVLSPTIKGSIKAALVFS